MASVRNDLGGHQLVSNLMDHVYRYPAWANPLDTEEGANSRSRQE